MKSKTLFVSMLVIGAMALGIVVSVGASASHVAVTGTETPLCLPPEPHPDCTIGEWMFPDGNKHVRNMVQVYAVEGSDPRIIGVNTLIVNANWDADGLGPGWGTFHHQPQGFDGYWEGTFSAVMTTDGYVSRIRGKGYGDLDGLIYRATEVNGYFEGVILELPNK